MSGHSKWATIKHKKGAADKARGKLFAKLIRQVEVAAREGGGDPDIEPHAAHDVPEGPGRVGAARHHRAGHQAGHRRARGRHATSRSPTRATRPAAWPCYVEVLTDNRNRTGAEVRSIFTKHGGSMAEPGAVAWQFERKGVVLVDRSGRRGRR